MINLKRIIFILILAVSIWLLWPKSTSPPSSVEHVDVPQKDTPDNSSKKYVIRVAPDIYMPGTMPMGAGKPLEALTHIAEQFETLFPDTKIVYENVPAGVREWLITQVSAGQAPDILWVNVE